MDRWMDEGDLWNSEYGQVDQRERKYEIVWSFIVIVWQSMRGTQKEA